MQQRKAYEALKNKCYHLLHNSKLVFPDLFTAANNHPASTQNINLFSSPFFQTRIQNWWHIRWNEFTIRLLAQKNLAENKRQLRSVYVSSRKYESHFWYEYFYILSFSPLFHATHNSLYWHYCQFKNIKWYFSRDKKFILFAIVDFSCLRSSAFCLYFCFMFIFVTFCNAFLLLLSILFSFLQAR